jgi:hypothetical protein
MRELCRVLFGVDSGTKDFAVAVDGSDKGVAPKGDAGIIPVERLHVSLLAVGACSPEIHWRQFSALRASLPVGVGLDCEKYAALIYKLKICRYI